MYLFLYDIYGRWRGNVPGNVDPFRPSGGVAKKMIIFIYLGPLFDPLTNNNVQTISFCPSPA